MVKTFEDTSYLDVLWEQPASPGRRKPTREERLARLREMAPRLVDAHALVLGWYAAYAAGYGRDYEMYPYHSDNEVARAFGVSISFVESVVRVDQMMREHEAILAKHRKERRAVRDEDVGEIEGADLNWVKEEETC